MQQVVKYTTVWQPQEGPQTWLLSCPVFETLFGGARGGGKSDGILGEWAAHADEYGDQAIGLCVRRERTQLLELIERSKTIYFPLGAKFDAQDKMWRFPNGARLRFAYLESDDDAQHYQGHSYTRVYVEEMGTFPNPEPIFKLMATLSRNPNVLCRFIATANPGGPGHLWIKQRYIDPDPKGMRIIQTEYTNPFTNETITKERIFIPSKVTDNKYTNTPTYIGNLYMSGNEELVKAWLKGDWDVTLGAFFPEFSKDKHVIRSFVPPKHWTRFMAMDWGSSTPFSIGWYCVVPDEFDPHLELPLDAWAISADQLRQGTLPKGAIIKYREWYGSLWRENIEKGVPNAENITANTGLKLTAKEVARGIALRESNEPRGPNGRPRITWRVADPKIFSSDNGPSVAENFGSSPYFINFARADNKRVARGGAISGWDALRDRLKGTEAGSPMIYFMDTCLDTIRTLPALQHDPKRMEDAQTDGEDHCFTGSTLVSTPNGYVQIKDLKEGYVNTIDGPKYFYNGRRTKKNTNTVTLKFNDGSEITCTPEHKFLTFDGKWKKAIDMLDERSYAVSNIGDTAWTQSKLAKQYKYFSASGITFAENIFKETALDYTGKCGNSITVDTYLMDFTYITKTKTNQIINRVISNFLKAKNTVIYTLTNKSTLIEQSKQLNTQELPLVSGMVPMKDGNGTNNNIKNTVKKLFFAKKLKDVLRATKSLMDTQETGTTIVQMRVNQPTEESPAKIISKPHVQYVDRTTEQINIEVQKPVLENAARNYLVCVEVKLNDVKEDVYCITVPSTQSFILSNGAVVANCPDETRYACMSRPYSRTNVDTPVRGVIRARDNTSLMIKDDISLLREPVNYNSARIH